MRLLLVLCISTVSLRFCSATCDFVTLRAESEAEWSVDCVYEDADSSSDSGYSVETTTLDPSSVQQFFVNGASSISMLPSSQSPQQVYLTSQFHRVEPLVSSTITTLYELHEFQRSSIPVADSIYCCLLCSSLTAAPQWVHKTPVAIASTAFAELSALQTLCVLPCIESPSHGI